MEVPKLAGKSPQCAFCACAALLCQHEVDIKVQHLAAQLLRPHPVWISLSAASQWATSAATEKMIKGPIVPNLTHCPNMEKALQHIIAEPLK